VPELKSVGVLDIADRARAEVDLKLEPVQRVLPTLHLRIDESSVAAFADSGHMRVIVNQPFGIDILERALNKVAGLLR